MGTITFPVVMFLFLTYLSFRLTEELKTTAVELQDLVHAKVGVTTFSTA
jgi:hypothetical protein